MSPIDLRSDTVTRPSAAMRRAMAEAAVGDDVYGEDPSVNRLQEMAAERLGKEAALFVPSGTMANQAALASQTRPGDLVLATRGAHLLLYESGAASALSGLQIEIIAGPGGPSEREVAEAQRPDDHHFAPPTLLAFEITHNVGGGVIPSLARVEAACAMAHARGLRTHLDGARLFNAEVASGVPAARWAAAFDTVSFCLSKGLGAPLGSMVCADRATIDRVHRMRKMLGGAMRQAGVVAAAGIYALENHVARLAQDHDNARVLAGGLAAIGISEVVAPETNIVLFDVEDAAEFVRAAGEVGVLLGVSTPTRVRAVTHLDVSAADITEALSRLRSLAAPS